VERLLHKADPEEHIISHTAFVPSPLSSRQQFHVFAMRYSLALASLVALASAAPLQHNNPAAVEDAASAKTNFSPLPPFHFVWTPNGQPPVKEKRNSKMATDIKYNKYPSYKPYGGYAPYSAVVEAEAAKGMISFE
jgi:hypothetical protein